MPYYEYECFECEERKEVVCRIKDRPKELECGCGGKMRQIVSKPQIIRPWEPYVDENICEKPILVKSREHRKQLMKEHGLVDAGSFNRGRHLEKVKDREASVEWKHRKEASEEIRRQRGEL